MVPVNVKLIAVYPAYFVVLGPSNDVTRPKMWEQPEWDCKLFPRKSCIEMGLRGVSDVPLLPDHVEVTRDFLPLKQKRAPMHLWERGVHQLLLWVGYSRPSKQSAHHAQLKFAWRRYHRR